MYCPHCGKEVADDAAVCVGCGRSLQGAGQGRTGSQMTRRSPAAVLLLPFVTFGIYELYWLVRTKTEMNAQGAKIPTAWLLIVPIANWYWLWRFSVGVQHVTGGKTSAATSFLLYFFLSVIGAAIIQNELNKAAA